MTNLDDLMRRLASGELADEHEAITLKPVHELTPRDIDLIVANQRLARLRWESGVKTPKAKPKVSVDLSSVMGALAPKPEGSQRRR